MFCVHDQNPRHRADALCRHKNSCPGTRMVCWGPEPGKGAFPPWGEALVGGRFWRARNCGLEVEACPRRKAGKHTRVIHVQHEGSVHIYLQFTDTISDFMFGGGKLSEVIFQKATNQEIRDGFLPGLDWVWPHYHFFLQQFRCPDCVCSHPPCPALLPTQQRQRDLNLAPRFNTEATYGRVDLTLIKC